MATIITLLNFRPQESFRNDRRDYSTSKRGKRKSSRGNRKMPESDSKINTLTSLPEGARLAQFREAWEGVTTNAWSLDILRNGYLPKFKSKR